MAVLVHGKEVSERALRGFKHSILDSMEFFSNVLAVWVDITQRTKHVHCLVLFPMVDKPPRTLRHAHDERKDEEAEDDLKGKREAPRDLTGIQEIKAKVDPWQLW